ncbi:uncharacterized protein TOT_030000076 [Theileria orientalis strain Shintoku]|uniref:MACPF domain-containing protein n=1 Tax=Theileria orientalis strain Shintoku TaxID=869250 RepID=J4DPJ5_THEOR|nr:uncharacterized protein TOT_030000076 [Theileria orientalis strain Shintoku]BAM40814.1 uncharacterized protein TOT_030000076 [Theileria orientalis strain Shintoku]|eukprot:XP_009691115.1 uncharacterized protein TOT_030000076 [Theileria orientalis strain Shintoku]
MREYLGLGYNIKESMPLGNEEDIIIDPGYKEPVISFEYEHGFDIYSTHGKHLPFGVWTRNESLCYKTVLLSKGSKGKSMISVLSEDIQLSIVGMDVYSGKKLSTNLSNTFKDDQMNVFKLNCSIYTTGMILSNQWKLKGSIIILLNKINNYINSNVNPENDDQKVKNAWYQLFNQYGTHIMTKITLGGKIVEMNNNKEESSESKAEKENKMKLNLEVFKLSTDVESNKSNEELNKNKYEKIIIIGGNVVSNDLDDQSTDVNKEKWIKTIKYNPVPIQFELSPLSYFIHQNYQNDNLMKALFNKYNNSEIHSINNIEFLGCGYSFDHLKQNINNFKSPIIQNYESAVDVQDQFICDISTEQLNIENEQEVVKKIYTHNQNSSSNAYSSYNNEEFINDDIKDVFSKHKNLMIKKYKCIVYKSTLVSKNLFESHGDAENVIFLRTLNGLYNNCKHNFDASNCDVATYKKNSLDPNCIKCVMPWVQFFKDYGLYVTNQITMGGIINKFYDVNKYNGSSEKKYNRKNINESSTFFKLVSHRSEENDSSSSDETNKEHLEEVYTLTVGPEPSGNKLTSKVISEWLQDVIRNPTPIDFELIPIKEIIPKEYLQIYSDASDYYLKLRDGDVLVSQMDGTNNIMINILKKSKNAVKILTENEKHVKVCGGEEKAMLGFCMSLNSNGELRQLQLLNNKLNQCLFTENTSSVLMWSLCTINQLQDSKQMIYRPKNTDKENKKLRCPANMAILYGFIVNVKNPTYIKLCKSGERSCSDDDININGFIWLFCIPKNIININFIKSILKTGVDKVENGCPDKYKLIHGIKFMFHQNNDNPKDNLVMEPCSPFVDNCNINCKDCKYVAKQLVKMLFLLYLLIFNVLCSIQLDKTSKHDIIKKINKVKKIPSLEYLGCGYDILFGNPLTDSQLLVDPGFRDPIVSYSVMFKKNKLFQKVSASNITNAWIRPLIECKRSNERTVVDNLENYKSLISVDSDISASTIDESAKFSLSTNYSEISDLLKSNKSKLYVDKSYCFLLEAGIPLNHSLKLKNSFIAAARKLKTNFNKYTENCSVLKYTVDKNSDECKEVKAWMDMFEQFGTHFSYDIKLGGRITYITQEETSKDNKNNEKQAGVGISGKEKRSNISGEANVDFVFGKKSNQSKNLSFKHTNILGGLPIGDINKDLEYVKWIKSVYKYPMPIRSQFAPISKLFKTKALKEAYNEAYGFYLGTKGINTKN